MSASENLPKRELDPAVVSAVQSYLRLDIEQRRAAAEGMLCPDEFELNLDPDPSTTLNWADMAAQIGPLRWAWEKWLPQGLLTILAGESGSGKSALALRIAACFLRGDPWPDGSPFTAEQGAVLWCEAEAAQAINLNRAQAWGLPLERLLIPLGDPLQDLDLDQPHHQGALIKKALQPEVRLVIIDSLRGTQQGDENSSGGMGVVRWLAEAARDTGKPIVLTHHLRKRSLIDSDTIELDRLRGSSAIVQPARVVWALDVPDPLHKENKRFQVIKSNLACFPTPLGVSVNPSGLCFSGAPQAPHVVSAVDRAAELLLVLLAKCPMRSTQVREEIEQAGISWRSANEAKKRLGILAVHQDNVWFWALPSEPRDNDAG